MLARLHLRGFLVGAALLCLAPFLSAQDGLKGAVSQADFTTSLGNTLAVANLDGDNQADGAILLDSKRLGSYNSIKIELHFTNRPNSELTFESNGQPVAVRAWDVDHDGDTDLVVEDVFTHKPVRVWINEGHGDFHEGSVQDYTSLAFIASGQLQLPSNRPGDLPLGLPPQRSFDISVLTVHALGRPPSPGTRVAAAIDPSAKSHSHTSPSSRAPPFLA
ncbi:MAG TPA: hypothetical protein VKH81_24735 [Candidatus Angelobacter sp.]|nr:hypothetical protein [Candidatus Angelobacter sp.]